MFSPLSGRSLELPEIARADTCSWNNWQKFEGLRMAFSVSPLTLWEGVNPYSLGKWLPT